MKLTIKFYSFLKKLFGIMVTIREINFPVDLSDIKTAGPATKKLPITPQDLGIMARPATGNGALFELWDQNVGHHQQDSTNVLYIDRHLVQEVTSPQAFREGLRNPGRITPPPECHLGPSQNKF